MIIFNDLIYRLSRYSIALFLIFSLNKDYLISFITASSIGVIGHFLVLTSSVSDDFRIYSYKNYSILAPIYLGLCNILFLYLAKQYNWSDQQRYTYSLSVIIIPYIFNLSGWGYRYINLNQKILTLFITFLFYFIAFLKLIPHIENIIRH